MIEHQRRSRYILETKLSMSGVTLTKPIVFEPVFMERMWGGCRLESEFQKKLPPNTRIGEAWEIVDRPEAQSIVRDGALRGKPLHELWTKHRQSIFGNVPDSLRFPLLVKLVDAREKLSLQVHPPEEMTAELGGEPKTEFWYVAIADPGARLFVGLKEAITRDRFEEALRSGAITKYLHSIPVKAGDAMFLPAGRLHAVDAGNVLVEIQQNSDTTYRVFDWNRVDDKGESRKLHVDQAFQCIDFNDVGPKLIEPKGELLICHELFEIQKWKLDAPRDVASRGQFAIVCCLSGSIRCADVDFAPGEFFLLPAQLQERRIKPVKEGTSLLRVRIPNQA